MPLKKGKGSMKANMKKMVAEGRPMRQAMAIAMESEKGPSRKKMRREKKK